MLKVFKEGHVAVVTRGAYEDIYKPLGYTIASDKEENKPEIVENNVEEKVSENDEVMEQTEEVEENKVDNEIKQNNKRK